MDARNWTGKQGTLELPQNSFLLVDVRFLCCGDTNTALTSPHYINEDFYDLHYFVFYHIKAFMEQVSINQGVTTFSSMQGLFTFHNFFWS